MGSNNFNNADFEYFSIVRVCVAFPKLYYLTFYGISFAFKGKRRDECVRKKLNFVLLVSNDEYTDKAIV